MIWFKAIFINIVYWFFWRLQAVNDLAFFFIEFFYRIHLFLFASIVLPSSIVASIFFFFLIWLKFLLIISSARLFPSRMLPFSFFLLQLHILLTFFLFQFYLIIFDVSHLISPSGVAWLFFIDLRKHHKGNSFWLFIFFQMLHLLFFLFSFSLHWWVYQVIFHKLPSQSLYPWCY